MTNPDSEEKAGKQKATDKDERRIFFIERRVLRHQQPGKISSGWFVACWVPEKKKKKKDVAKEGTDILKKIWGIYDGSQSDYRKCLLRADIREQWKQLVQWEDACTGVTRKQAQKVLDLLWLDLMISQVYDGKLYLDLWILGFFSGLMICSQILSPDAGQQSQPQLLASHMTIGVNNCYSSVQY